MCDSCYLICPLCEGKHTRLYTAPAGGVICYRCISAIKDLMLARWQGYPEHEIAEAWQGVFEDIKAERERRNEG